MKILKIGGKNLASLAGEFSVDFEREPLASSGLFAISGPTGAGKSTLLDALCLALYDATPRLLKAVGRTMLPDVGAETVTTQDTRTLLRRGTAEGYAEVDFIGNDGAAYRARWSVRRSRTRAEGALQPTAMSLLLLPALQPVGGTKTEVKAEIEKRIGLSFEQFTRAVLLAQNEFSTFLKAEDNERGELLETLTGSTVYTEISMRAFERAKLEQAALQRLNARLADQKPLAGDERAELERQAQAADAALQALDQHKAQLEHQLRWHQQSARLADDELQAHLAWQAGVAEHQLAAPRRAALAQLDAVQPARPLSDEIKRIDADIDHSANAIATAQAQTAQADAAQRQAETALAQADAAVHATEQRRHDAGPPLDQAKALDARIEAMLPAHRQAAAASEQADLADLASKQVLQARQDDHARIAQQQQAGAAWLERHQHWQALALSWPRWDVLFVQAGQAAALSDKLAKAWARVQHNGKLQREQLADASARLAGADTARQALEARRQQTIAALAQYAPQRMREQRQALEQRRELLAGAEKIWFEFDARQARAREVDQRTGQLQQARAGAETKLEQTRQAHLGLMAALGQAERSLKLAEAACADNVLHLRAALEDDTPCPVCGAHEHPYRHDDGALQAMLAGLQGEVARCRQQAEDNIGAQASERATAQASVEQLTALATESGALAQALERAGAAWHAHPLAADASLPFEADRAAWFEQQLAQARAALEAQVTQEQAWHQAGVARDQAQTAFDQAAAEHARLLGAASGAQAALALIDAEQTALDGQRIEAALQLDALLSDLDPAFSGSDLPNDEWKEDWRTGPARFYEARQAESRQWLAQKTAFDERGAALAAVDTELKAARDAQQRTGRDALAAGAAFGVAGQALDAMQQQRMALWGGKEASAVERQLQADIDAARAQLAARQDALRQAAQARVRFDEAQAQAQLRLADFRQRRDAAQSALAQWLQAFQQRHADNGNSDGDGDCDGGQPVDLAQLQALLACPQEDLEAQRAALQALEQAMAHAATVLRERQRQRALHLEQQPAQGLAAVPSPDDAAPPEHEQPQEAAAPDPIAQLATALNQLAVERKGAHQSAAALQVALAQDSDKRRQAHAMLEEIARQEAIEQRWSRMSELIGSADGKKFRNYAQQFTLDVLLGYANAHLAHLARRYQLERINNPANPSLGLLVRDQDMGGEMRSVHSLSGGESFLVSLALALGLASLSSNRVRVESLFIDEGFGSLDAETLRVAMDALDGLQSMGRKVGVISHVQEMTERISTKILVRPSSGGRSVVSVE